MGYLSLTHSFSIFSDDIAINKSYMFACVVDFHKAFDKSNYWKLFLNLLDDGEDNIIVRVLSVWYSKQSCYVKWQNVVSREFSVRNGTRQGGILSPYCFHATFEN